MTDFKKVGKRGEKAEDNFEMNNNVDNITFGGGGNIGNVGKDNMGEDFTGE